MRVSPCFSLSLSHTHRDLCMFLIAVSPTTPISRLAAAAAAAGGGGHVVAAATWWRRPRGGGGGRGGCGGRQDQLETCTYLVRTKQIW